MSALKCLLSDAVFRLANSLPPYLAFNELRCALYRAAGAKIGPGARIDKFLYISPSSRIPSASNIIIGSGTYLNADTRISARFQTVTIGRKCLFGPDVLLETSTHSTTEWDDGYRRLITGPIHIGDRVWICARAVILPGVTIGDEAIVAAGAVVIRDVPPRVVVGGVPAKVIKVLDSVST